MARRKVKLSFIANDSARKASFRKRKNGLLKKMKELSTLCDVSVTAVIYNPGEIQPEIWPLSVSEVNAALIKFRQLPEMNQRKKMMDQERFLMQRIVKVGEQYKKLARDNHEKQVLLTMYGNLDGTLGLQGMSGADLEELGRVIDKTLTEIDDSRKNRMLIADNKHRVEELRWLSPPPAINAPFMEESEPSEIKSVDQYMPFWSIDLMNPIAPPPPLLLPPAPQMPPQMAGDYFFNGGGDCSGGGYIGGGGDQQNAASMFPLIGDNQFHNNNYNATSSSSNNILWPNHNSISNMFYP